MKHLRIDTTEEELVLRDALTAFQGVQEDATGPTARTARALLARLTATPLSRHGGVVHTEDANYPPTPAERQ